MGCIMIVRLFGEVKREGKGREGEEEGRKGLVEFSEN
jgi:hypothetical protein